MLNVRKAVVAVFGALLASVIMNATNLTVMASDHTKVLESLNSGLGMVLDPSMFEAANTQDAILAVQEEEILIAGDALNEGLWLFNYGSLSMMDLYQTIKATTGLDFSTYLCGHSNEEYHKEKL